MSIPVEPSEFSAWVRDQGVTEPAALMALSGVRSFVSPDEVILTMREVGERINSDYKETARAGLAKTRDGKHVEKMFESEVRKFFS